jgi:hypothetical protein
MPASHPLYRSLVRLYPRDFRRGYGDDLVQHFADLVTDRGARLAWTRTGIDLIVTVPRYRLEHLMTEQHSTTTLNLTVGALAGAGALSILAGLYPGAVLLVAAAAVAVSQRGTLARSIRTPDSSARRRRLATASVLAVVFLLAMASYLRAIGDEHVSGTSLVLHNAVGVPAMVGAIGFLIAGLLTPKEPAHRLS